MNNLKNIFIFLNLFNFSCFAIDITGLDGRAGNYNSKKKTASFGTGKNKISYFDIVEYSQAVTPPNIKNPELIAFAIMPNPKYKEDSDGRMGGQRRTITLYGIPQDVTEPSNQDNNSFTIYGSQGKYNHLEKTAYLIDLQGKKTEYTDIVEYSQAVTPPNIKNPQLKSFATMPNPKYKESKRRRMGGQNKYVTLYGIEKR